MGTDLVQPALDSAALASSGLALEAGGNLDSIRVNTAATVTNTANAGTPNVSDRAGRLLGIVASIAAAVDVSDRAARALGIVASITAPVDVSDRAARALGIVASITAAVDVSDRVGRLLGVSSRTPATLNATVAGAAAAAATATLPAVAGQFHYITHISIRRVATAALAGGAILAVTSTNLGGRSWRTGNQASILADTMDGGLLLEADYSHPLKSAIVNNATTIICPAPGAAVSWHIQVDYYTAA